MPGRNANREAALRTVDGFVDEFAAKLPLTAASEARGIVKTAVADLDTNTGAGATTRRVQAGITQRLRVAKQTLLEEYMLPVSRMAAANLQGVPEFAALKMPHTNIGFAELVKAGNSMADVAEQHMDVLGKAGLPADFLARLRQAASTLKASIDARSNARRSGVGATRAVSATLTLASQQVRVLDALVRVDARNDPSLLAQWKSAKHPKKSPTAHETAPPAAAPATTAMPATAQVTAQGGTQAAK